jgi:putative oxygen-independent coproporphyrinogen III oxidase
MKNISNNPGLYIHIPFCDTKCGYCDFYSITNHSSRSEFIESLLKEIRFYGYNPANLAGLNKSVFDTIYLGGGTPSLFTEFELTLIFEELNKFFTFSADCEITLEANPGTVNKEKFQFYKSIGVNRLSIGIQSFKDDELKYLGRIHDSAQAVKTVEEAQNAGFDNLSIDLIFATPNQTLDDWLFSLNKGIALTTQHISAYNLIFEEGTPFYKKLIRGQIFDKSEQEQERFYAETMSVFAKNGFEQYEISSYARLEKYYSRHNYKYWDHTNYLSFGPSAHSYWDGTRWSNVRSLSVYIRNLKGAKSVVDFEETLDRDTRIFEKIMLGLRTKEGIDLKKFEKEFNISFLESYAANNKKLLDGALVEITDGYFHLTQKGIMICDEIIAGFVPN